MNGSMERKMKDGSWRDAPECCIFFGEFAASVLATS